MLFGVIAGAVGCFGPGEWTDIDVDDACELSEVGYDGASDDAIEALDRANCHRRMLGLEAGVLDERLDDASQAHAEYMAGTGVIGHAEDSGTAGYTGDQVWDRIAAAGYDDQAGTSISEVVAQGPGAADVVDLWIDSVYHRAPFTAPEWIATGFGLAGEFSAMAFVMPYPQGSDSAVVYPANGQVNVPFAFDSDTESPDPAPSHGVVGYPVTVSVSSSSPENGLELVRGELRGPSGRLDVLELEPQRDDGLYDMVALVPVEPLEPDAAYDAEIRVRWNGRDETLLVHFETTGEP